MDISKYYYVLESKLTTEERKNLPDSAFGLPKLRKFPIHDERHIHSAISYFHTCSEDKKPELAKNIAKVIEENGYEINLSDKIKKYL